MADTDPAEFVLYDVDTTTKLAILPYISGHIYAEFQEPGSGEVRIPLDSAAAALVSSGQFIRVNYRGATQFAFFVDNIKQADAGPDEGGGRVLSISGRGAMAHLDEAIVWDDGSGVTTREFIGQSKGHIFWTLYDEAYDRVALRKLEVIFDTYDTDGNLFTDSEDYKLPVGMSMLDLLRKFAKTGDLEFKCYTIEDPAPIQLEAYINGVGTDKSDTIYFRIGTNCAEVESDERNDELKNAMRVKFRDGYITVSDSASITSHRRRETLLNIEAAQSGDSASTYAAAQLENQKDPRKAISVRVYDGVSPNVFLDYDLGDMVTLDRFGTETSYRVLGLQLQFVSDQPPLVVVDLNNIIYDNDLKVANDLDDLLQRWNTARDTDLTEVRQWMSIGTPNGEVYTLHHYNGFLYVGGDFTAINNIGGGSLTCSYVARYDTSTGAWAAMGAEISQIVRDIIDVAGTLYAITEDKIYRWDSTAWTLIGTATCDTVGLMGLATDGTDLYVCGDPSDISGTSISKNVAKWTGSWASVSGGALTRILVRQMVFWNGVLFAGKSMSSGPSGLMKYTAGAWTSVLASGFTGTDVNAMTIQGDNLIFSHDNGNIYSWDGVAASATLIGTASTYGSENQEQQDALAVYLSDIVYGAQYIGMDSVTGFNNIGKYSGGTWNKIGAGFSTATPVGRNDRIAALEFVDTDLYAGGLFTTADGKTISNLAIYITSFESLMDHLSHDGQFDMGAAIHNATASAITDNDEVPFWEDVANGLRKITWANIKATLKTYLDTLYATISHNHSGIYAPILHLHGASEINNRTRYIPVTSVWDASAGTAVPVTDAHGTLSQEPHFHLADGVTTIIKCTFTIPVPEDYVSGTVNINFLWSSSVANNNVRWQVIVREVGNGDASHTSLLVDTTTVAVGAAANTILKRTVALTSNPTAGKDLSFNVIRLGADAADTNTGQVSLWGIYLDYTADS